MALTYKPERAMEIKVRVITHTYYEIEMGHVNHYRPLPEVDAVSVTANASGFTTLTAVARTLGLDLKHVRAIADHSNSVERKTPWTLVLEEPSKFCLIFVPRTDGKSDASDMTRKLLEDAEIEQVRVIEFSHFNFIQNKFPVAEIESALQVMTKWTGRSPTSVIFDIDARFVDNLRTIVSAINALD